ncbi:MAG: cytochrome c [Caldilinea sp. CFX5]|nr:cytochrome c [Caldilinea sp. CFX5]
MQKVMMNAQWRTIGILLVGSTLMFACVGTAPPAITERVQPAPNLVQPLVIEDLYWTRASRQIHTAGGDGEELSDAEAIELGAQLYAVNCAPCHQANGEGVLNRFPALNRKALVTARNPQALIQTVLYGRGVMPGFAPTLNNREIAAVLSYIRNAWSNSASVIAPSQVNEVSGAPVQAANGGEEMGRTSP